MSSPEYQSATIVLNYLLLGFLLDEDYDDDGDVNGSTTSNGQGLFVHYFVIV